MTPREAALKALKAYLQRGEEALLALEKDDVEAAISALSRRTEAYHNYLAIEALAAKSGFLAACDDEARAALERGGALDSRLEKAAQIARMCLSQKLNRLDSVRQFADACRSGTPVRPRLVRSA